MKLVPSTALLVSIFDAENLVAWGIASGVTGLPVLNPLTITIGGNRMTTDDDSTRPVSLVA